MVAEEKYFKVIEINGQSMSVMDGPYKSWYETGELAKRVQRKPLLKRSQAAMNLRKKNMRPVT